MSKSVMCLQCGGQFPDSGYAHECPVPMGFNYCGYCGAKVRHGEPHLCNNRFVSDQPVAIEIGASSPPTPEPKYSHYFRACPYDHIDIYRVLDLFDVAHPAAQHAVKKVMAAGKRGAKDARKDAQEAIDTLSRWLEMMAEDDRMASGDDPRAER